MNRPSEIVLNLSEITDATNLHECFAKKLNFPSFYGRNFDAFWDCISDNDLSQMPNRLIVKGIQQLEKNLPNEHEKFVSCLKDYQSNNPDREVVYS